MHRNEFVFHRMGSDERRRVLEVLKRAILGELSGVLIVAVFGSFVDAPAFRDIDTAVYLENVSEDPLDLEWRLSDRLTGVLGIPVDVKVLNTAPPMVRYRILRRGIILYEASPGLSERIAFASAREHMDMALKRLRLEGYRSFR